MRIDILTLFPGMLGPVLGESILRLAQEKGLVQCNVVNIRDFAEGRHRQVDDRPYGGGPGMVMMPGPVFAAVESVDSRGEPGLRRILLTPQGRRFDQRMAKDLAGAGHLVLVCGRYEGFDERIHEALGAEEVSIGDFVLSGGEIAAMAVVEAVVRLLPGALGDEESATTDSLEGNLLKYPQYTRPPEFRGMRVPEVLLSGNHEMIARWRAEMSRRRTLERRPDLISPDNHEQEEKTE